MSAGKALSNLKLEKLKPDHQVEEFACGHEALDRYLRRFAWANQKAEAAQTYVAVHESRTVIGYYSLAVGQVTFDDAPERLAKGLARHPVPVMLLARLAVDQGWHGHRLGSALLRDAVLRTLQAADIAGIRAMVVHAKDDAARRFYERFDFLPFTNEPLTLHRLIKDLRRAAQPEADASWGCVAVRRVRRAVILPPCAWRQALHPGRDHRGRDEALELPVMRFDGGGAHAPLFCDDTLAAERDRRSPLLAFSDPPLSKAASPTSRHKALASSRPLAS